MESDDSPEIPDSGETSDIPGLPSGSALQESLLIFNARSTTTVISGRNTSHYSQANVRLTVYVTRPLMIEGQWGKSEVDGTEKTDAAKAISLTTVEASIVIH